MPQYEVPSVDNDKWYKADQISRLDAYEYNAPDDALAQVSSPADRVDLFLQHNTSTKVEPVSRRFMQPFSGVDGVDPLGTHVADMIDSMTMKDKHESTPIPPEIGDEIPPIVLPAPLVYLTPAELQASKHSNDELLRRCRNILILQATQIDHDKKLANAMIVISKQNQERDELRGSQLFECNNAFAMIANEFKCILRLESQLSNSDNNVIVKGITYALQHTLILWFNATEHCRIGSWKLQHFASFISSFSILSEAVRVLASYHFGSDISTGYNSLGNTTNITPMLMMEVLAGKGRFTHHEFVDVDDFDESFMAGDMSRPGIDVHCNITTYVPGKKKTSSVAGMITRFLQHLDK